MSREVKTVSEVEDMIFEKIKQLPNGELIESVYIILPPKEGFDPNVGVSWNEAGRDMRPAVTAAMRLAADFCRQYDVRED